MDKISAAERSRVMSRVKGKDTAPEMKVRRLVHSMGYRYRLHREDLPGKPDLVFSSLGKVIFVHGCFWHGHTCRRGLNRPAANSAYWTAKLDRNVERDRRNQRALRSQGWGVLVVWECQLSNDTGIRKRLERFLAS